MKSEKMKYAEKVRMDNAQKWADYFVSGQPLTEKKRKKCKMTINAYKSSTKNL